MNRDILDDIINEFEPEKFIRFFRAKNSSFSPRQEALTQYHDDNFKSGKKIGDIKFQDSSLIICTFQVLQPLSEKSGKRLQYEKGKKILKETQSDAGIFIFYDQSGNFRFSLIYANYLGRRRDWSTFRRFTYFVSKFFTNKTLLQRIGDGDFSNLEKIKEAFSVEKVTKAFYTDIANWYFWAVQNVMFPKDAEEEENGRNIAVIRLITRLIFIWFMKERGLISNSLFNQNEVSKFLNDLSPNKTTYYKAILQNLFFATLNTKTKDRKYRFQKSFQGKNPNYMDHSIYRYEDYFKNQEAMLAIFKDIPFLNGGLFDCLDRRFISDGKNIELRIDGFTDKEVGLKVPNFLFFSDLAEADLNQEYGTKNERYSVKGIINILSTYNFTIDENDPNDQEVALDPELLGKVFENLLASFNPETASTARKATGSYYTPREIVDYMVTQSLENYLKTSLEGIDELDSKLGQLLSNRDDINPFNHQETLKIVKLIDDLRIVDPAVGSGAFPMGVLNKLVFILAKLDPDNTLWKATQLKAVEDNITDPVLRKKLLDQIEDQFTQKNFDYGRKLYLIQKCIYGVDIQQIAVEIAKLRFFISLLVDEKIDKNKENWGIEPLPNLDYKIMQGNSIVDEYRGVRLFDERLLYVDLPDEEEIRNTKQRIKQIEKELMGYYRNNPQWMKNPKLERPQELFALEGEFRRLRTIEKDLTNLSTFNVKNQTQSLFPGSESESQKVWVQLQDLHKQIFAPSLTKDERNTLRQEVDELEWRLIEETLREQDKIRELEKIKRLENSNTKPFFLWKLYFPEVFEEKGGFDIVIANPPYGVDIEENDLKTIKKKLKDTANTNSAAIFIDFGKNLLLNKKGTLSYIVPKSLLFSEQWFDLVEALIGKVTVLVDVEKAFENVLLEQVVFVYGNSLSTKSYLARKFLNNEFIRSTQINNKVIFKYRAWLCDVTDNDLQLGNKIISNEQIELMSRISDTRRGVGLQRYLKKEGVLPVIGGKNIIRYGFNGYKGYLSENDLASNKSKVEFMNQPKIMSQNLVAHVQNPVPHLVIIATYDERGKVLSLDTVNNTVLTSTYYQPKYILSIMNSSLICWYAYKFIYCAAIRTMHFDNNYVGKIPIFKANNEEQKPLIELVNKIFAITNSGGYITNSEKQAKVKDYEDQIDKLVYKLYGLTPEEIAVVEDQ